MKEQVITVDRLKPAFGFADPAPQIPRREKEAKATAPKKWTKNCLNPEAEIFVPGRKAEKETSTTSRSKFGRTRRPPERLGIRSNL